MGLTPCSRANSLPLPGLRAVLFLLVLASVVPLLALTVYSTLDQRRQVGERIVEEAARVARLAALRQGDLVDSGHEMLLRVAALPSLHAGDEAGCSTELGEILPLFPRFRNMGVVDRAGNLVCSAIGVSQERTLNFADRAWFRRALDSGRFAAGDYQLGRITRKPSLVFGLPLLGPGGEVQAVAWAALDLGWLQHFAAKVGLPSDAAFTIVDRNGVVLARHPDPQRWVGKQLAHGPAQSMVAKGEDTAEVEGLDGVRRLYAFTPLGDTKEATAYVFVGIPTSVAYGEANQNLQRNLLLLAVIALAGLGTAWFVARHLVLRPAQTLTRAAQRLAAGDLDTRIGPCHLTGELGAVAHAFDDMASSLQRRDAELRGALEQWEQSEAQLQSIVDEAPVIIVVKDPDGRYLLVNRRFEQATGFCRQDVRGRTDHEVFDPETAAALADDEREALMFGTTVEREISIPRDGRCRTYISVKFPLQDARGAPYAVCGIATDITERTEAQAEREALTRHVQQVERLESLGQLAGGVAHDFNNLLAIILNYADFVLQALPEHGPELNGNYDGIRSDVAAIAQAARSAAALTRQLLIFARRDAAQPTQLDLNGVVEHLEPLLRRTLGEDIALEAALAPDVGQVEADRGHIEQIIVNLAVNARDAMGDGGKLTIRTEDVEIDASAAATNGVAAGRYARLTVADSGAGMAPDVAARAFEPFFTTKPMGHGTGLGLATVFGIVTDAGGRIRLESRLGKGTSVFVDLPVAVAEVTEVSGDHGPEDAAGGQETVLVVEDEEPVRRAAERILRRQGYNVLAAPDAVEALRTCRDHQGPIDLLVTDVVMPGLSGPRLVQRARALCPGLRSIYLSGYPEEVLARRHQDKASLAVLAKPFTAESLLQTVRRALDSAAVA